MSRIYKGMCACFLAALLLVLVIAVFDRDESAAPSMSISSLADGSYFARLQEHFNASFPGKTGMAEDYAKLEEFYNFGEKPEETEK